MIRQSSEAGRLRLIDRELLQASYIFGLVPYPGSQLFASPKSFGMELLHRDFRYYHEELPPVYETAFAKPDEIHEMFLKGVKQLGQAMGRDSSVLDSSHIGDPSILGGFWAGSHV